MTGYTFSQLIDFTRTSAATYVNSAGNIVSTPASVNLLTFTQEFDNAAWTKTRSTVTADSTVAPDGTSTADKVIANSDANYHAVQQSFTFSSGVAVFSIYAKAAEYSLFRMFDINNGDFAASFDLTNGTVSNTGGPKFLSASAVAVGNGWYRCILAVNNVSATRSPGFIGYPAGATLAVYGANYTGDGTSGVFAWGAQIEAASAASTYTRNFGGLFPPRFDYDPVTLAPRGLLVEEQRTNLLLRSEEFDNAFWQKTNITVTSAATASPDGTNNAQRVEATTTANANIFSTSAAVAATSATYSVYVKQGTGPTTANTFAIRNTTTATTLLMVTVNFSTGSVISYINGTTGASLQNAGNGWWRVVLTVTSGLTSGDTVACYPGFVGGAQTAGDHIFLYGAQLEAGSFATSYIPTTASQVTRAADVATVTGANFSQWYNQSEGTIVFSGSVIGSPGASTVNFVQLSDGSSNSVAIDVGMFDLSAPIFQVANGTTQASLDLGSMSANSIVNIAGAYKTNDFAGALNGGTVQTDTSGTVPTSIVRMGIGNRLGGVYMNGHIRSIRYYPTKLSNAQLQALSA